MISIKQDFHIPDNMAEWISCHDGVNLAFNINQAFGDDGYAHVTWYTCVLSRLTRTCHRCGYDPLWSPDDTCSKCIRHSYDAWRYDPVLIWSPKGHTKTLEESFEEWLSENPDESWKGAKLKIYGRTTWK